VTQTDVERASRPVYRGIGKALGTDFFLIRDELTDSELDYLVRTRRYVEDEVLPVINGYWERASSPGRWSSRWASSASWATASPATAARR